MPKITTTDYGYILETNFRFAANMFMLFNKNGDFVDKSTDYNFLHKKLLAMEKPKELATTYVPYFPYKFGGRIILN